MGRIAVNRERSKDVGREYTDYKSVFLQTEYLGTRLAKITVYGVLVDITADRLGAFLPNFARWKKWCFGTHVQSMSQQKGSGATETSEVSGKTSGDV